MKMKLKSWFKNRLEGVRRQNVKAEVGFVDIRIILSGNLRRLLKKFKTYLNQFMLHGVHSYTALIQFSRLELCAHSVAHTRNVMVIL